MTMALTAPTPRRLGYRFNARRHRRPRRSSCVWALVAIFAPLLIPYPIGEIVDFDYFGPMSASSGSAPTISAATSSRAF